MKYLRRLAASIVLLGASVSFAGELSSFPVFWNAYREYVVKQNREMVANLTHLPFYFGASLDRGKFLKAYPQIFGPKIQKCFQEAKPTADGEFFMVFCSPLSFRFGKVEGHWLLLEAADMD
jgi:hypothetical protein